MKRTELVTGYAAATAAVTGYADKAMRVVAMMTEDWIGFATAMAAAHAKREARETAAAWVGPARAAA